MIPSPSIASSAGRNPTKISVQLDLQIQLKCGRKEESGQEGGGGWRRNRRRGDGAAGVLKGKRKKRRKRRRCVPTLNSWVGSGDGPCVCTTEAACVPTG